MSGRLALILALLAPVALAADVVTTTAQIASANLQVGAHYEIDFSYKLSDGWSHDKAGLPSAILQIKSPGCVTLDGDVIEDHRKLAKNEFLHAPYERKLSPGKTKIGFTLNSSPTANDQFSFSVSSYLTSPDGKHRFDRTRIQLPVKPNATSTPADPDRSDWGPTQYLSIGDQADDFKLAKADGTKLRLSSFRNRKNVVIATYRAFW
jgi:hypothetical protein